MLEQVQRGFARYFRQVMHTGHGQGMWAFDVYSLETRLEM